MRFGIMQISDRHHLCLRCVSALSPRYQICLTSNTANVSLTSALMVCYDSYNLLTKSFIQSNVSRRDAAPRIRQR